MTFAVQNANLKAIDHRIVWWLLAHQVRDDRGIGTGTVKSGWRQRIMAELDIKPSSLCKAEHRLREAGIIEAHPYRRNVRVRGEAFTKAENKAPLCGCAPEYCVKNDGPGITVAQLDRCKREEARTKRGEGSA